MAAVPRYEQLEGPKNDGGLCHSNCCKKPLCCLGCLGVIVLALFSVGSYVAASGFVTLHDRTYNLTSGGKMVTPHNMSKKVYRGFMFLGQCASDQLLADFYLKTESSPWKLVTFPSRKGEAGQEVAMLTAWWLPAFTGQNGTAPRVVISHGFGSNFNDQSVQIPGYFLRSVGISVLLLNLRDHGSSQNTSVHWETFGYAYQLDVLGAWDFAVQDPDGDLGGGLAPEKVGVMGFSQGGYAAASAFGLEPKIAAAWLDSTPVDTRASLYAGTKQTVGGFLAWLITFGAYPLANAIAGVDLNLVPPGLALSRPEITNKRSVAVSANKLDNTVLFSQTEDLLSILKANPKKYEIFEQYIVEEECVPEFHVNIQIWRPGPYREALCLFWAHAFDMDHSICVSSELPKFPECQPVVCSECGSNWTRTDM
ncbi:unnamed protein product [Polarella glacialis]|uniref:Uncharacterized protein n=1 Tax=Polarella glacialis TaxID=89957 RepID=A0A813EN57_POLGL|nr:unnamed protein product [Polarella glacialis]